MANNVGDPTDSSGQIAVDFAWGNFPMQPNDDRAATITQTGGTTGSNLVSYKTFVVTAASATGGVVTYTSANTLQVGEIVTITGLSTGAFNLTSVTVGTVSSTQFTVTNAATGSAVTGATATATAIASVLPGAGADANWSATTKVASARLTSTLDGHNIVEGAYYGYPSYNTGLYKVTAATADGTRVLYTAQNNLKAGDVVSITGLTDGVSAGVSTCNLAAQTVLTATPDSFLIANAAAAKTITGQTNGAASLRYFDGANYMVTAASGNGTTVTYTSQNNLTPGATVSVTGLTVSALNLSSVTVATANAVSFTVTNSAGSGVSITGQTGKVGNDNAATNVDGALVASTATLNGGTYPTSTPYVQVPNVVGLDTTLALDGLRDRGLTATSSGTTSSVAKNITAVTRAAGSTLAVCTLTTHGLLEGHVVTASSSSLAGITNTVQYRVLYKIDANTFVINTSASTVLASGTVTLTPVVATVYSQSIAAGAATTASGAAITVNNWV